MARRRKSVNPAAERQRALALQVVGLAVLGLVTLFFVYKGMTVT
jgi:hypothetical protein